MGQTIKQLSSLMILNIDGGDRVSYTFNEIAAETGEPVSKNNKRSFVAVDAELRNHIEAIRDYIRQNKLEV
ncbi:MAG: hypothetical protein Q4F83_04925 [Eubacteriales bacterium]|nr:hypothetical protein [Eubacteriales bacterium]